MAEPLPVVAGPANAAGGQQSTAAGVPATKSLVEDLASVPDPRSRQGRLQGVKATSKAAATRRLAAHPEEAMALLLQ
jgi:hypothetical protein